MTAIIAWQKGNLERNLQLTSTKLHLHCYEMKLISMTITVVQRCTNGF